MLNIEKYKEELLEEFEKGNHFEQCIHEVGFRHGAFQLTPGVNVIYVGDLLDWLTTEYKEPILDDKEREYLSNVIKPFKDKIISICKCNFVIGERIIICIDDEGEYNMKFPQFEVNAMYKGMECNKDYTLKELGL